jgi:hypothetical protein
MWTKVIPFPPSSLYISFLNQFLKESRNKIICKLYEEETIFISAFNAENFMKIR